MKYRTSSYTAGNFNSFFFEKNLQGDIIAIYDESGTKIGSYIYDAWGNHTYSTVSGNTSLENRIVSTYNPFRYRGYFYDVETQWYYLQTRYYNPNWGRFINADTTLYSNLLGFNLFAYCYNNPVNYIDPYGESGTAALAGWAASSWWLTFADGVLPIGDIIYVVGCAVLTGVVVAETIFVAEEAATAIAKATDTTPEKAIPFPDPQPNEKGEEETEDIPNVEYPGDDPTVAPEGYE